MGDGKSGKGKTGLKILIGTPAYGGLLTTYYVNSLIETMAGFRRDKVDFALHTLTNESLIPRGRNWVASATMADEKVTHLLWIDADIGWKYSDICTLVNSNLPVVGGTYPMKGMPMPLNFNTFDKHNHFFVGGKYKKQFETFKRECKDIDNKGNVGVRHVPTGFLLIQKWVLHKLAEVVPPYEQKDWKSGGHKRNYDFHPCTVQNGVFESEDWGFCRLCWENNIPIHLNTKVVVRHSGTMELDFDKSN